MTKTNKLKLTKMSVEAIEPPAQGKKDVIKWDTELTGFGVRVKPINSRTGKAVCSYFIQGRVAGRSKRHTIGKHGVFTADEARKKATRLLANMADGIAPVAARKAAREAPTMNEMLDRFLQEHVAIHNKPSTRIEYARLIEKLICPAMGNFKVAGVTRQDVTKLHQSLKGTPRQANLVLSVLSKAFNLSEVWGFRPDSSNPCRLIKKFPENKRDRVLTNA